MDNDPDRFAGQLFLFNYMSRGFQIDSRRKDMLVRLDMDIAALVE